MCALLQIAQAKIYSPELKKTETSFIKIYVLIPIIQKQNKKIGSLRVEIKDDSL